MYTHIYVYAYMCVYNLNAPAPPARVEWTPTHLNRALRSHARRAPLLRLQARRHMKHLNTTHYTGNELVSNQIRD